jgi:hypothetical protein
MNKKKMYTISKAAIRPEMYGLWGGAAWADVPHLAVDCFRPEGTDHHPPTQCKLAYDEDRIYGLFMVQDRYVRCIHTGFQEPVWEDSCVEFFIQPKPDKGYFNFEFNCAGALLASYVTDPTRIDGRVAKAVPLLHDEGQSIEVYHSLPATIDPEIEETCTWFLEFSVPFTLFESYIGKIGKIGGHKWHGNLYKCGNKTSHPHWASWSPLSERNFHAPWDFGMLEFASFP